MPDENRDSTEVVQPIETEEHAVAELLEHIRHQAYGIALRILKDPEDAADVLQESFLKAYRNLPRFRGESSLSTWISAIVTHEAITALRRRFSRNEISLDKGIETKDDRRIMPDAVDPGDNPEIGAFKAEFRAIFAKTIEELDEKLRVVFVMHEMGDFSVEELAEILELSVPAARSRLFQARRRLEQRLRAHMGES